MSELKASFTPGVSVLDASGRRGHPDHIEQSERLVRKLYQVGDNAWTLVGNGLSNQSFVLAPEGLIVIDTGECIEEMQEALAEIRTVTDAPVVACIYTHFHYVNGTKALLAETGGQAFPIYGHEGIGANLQRMGGEVAPRSSRGMVHQFGVVLPEEGEAGLINVGLGRFFRNPGHAPFTLGHIPATHTFAEACEYEIAGLRVEMYPAPSDATDSITIWMPDLGVAINNLVWPALFNVFAIRGEEYRDPRILLAGLDQLADLGANHLLATHGPPMSGNAEIRERIIRYRDSIQYLWDQSVRGINRGLTADELVSFVQLPSRYEEDWVTRQFYGIAEHHVRQIYAGLFGWFDENEANLLPVPQPERHQRLVAGFGGVDAVRAQIDSALANADYRWALELGSWLIRLEPGANGRADGGEPEDRRRVARALRGVGGNTTSANLRNWCMTRALELEGELDLSRFRQHRFRVAEVASNPPAHALQTLKVLFAPEKAGSLTSELAFDFGAAGKGGLCVRNGVAVPTSGAGAPLCISVSHEDFAKWLAGKATYRSLVNDGALKVIGDSQAVEAVLVCFDIDLLGQ